VVGIVNAGLSLTYRWSSVGLVWETRSLILPIFSRLFTSNQNSRSVWSRRMASSSSYPTNMAASSMPVEWHHFVEVNSRNLGGSHVCWGSYDSFTFFMWEMRLRMRNIPPTVPVITEINRWTVRITLQYISYWGPSTEQLEMSNHQNRWLWRIY